MLARWFPCLTAVCVLAAASPTPAAEAKKPLPTLVVSVRSLDALIANTKYLIKLAGKEDLAKQYEGMLKAKIGKKGLDGIDNKRPLGMYATDLNNNSLVGMVPVADEKAILNLLKGLNLEAEKGENGLYTVSPDFLPVEFYFRFANKYAYVTALNSEAIDADKLLDPATVAPRGKTSLASISLHVERIPNAVKQLALSQLELQANRAKKQKPPRETEAEGKIRIQVIDDLYDLAKTVVLEGGEALLQFKVDRKANSLAAVASLTAKSGSKLTKRIADLGELTSLFAAATSGDTAMSSLIRFSVPEHLRKAVGPMIDDGLKRLRTRELNADKRALIDRFIKAVTPSLKAGEVDAYSALRGPTKDNLYAGIAAIRLQDAAEVEKLVRDVIKKAPESEQAKIKFDADKSGDIAIHRVTVKNDLDKKAKKLFGDSPLYFAFRKDGLFLALGDGGLDALKTILDAKPKAGPLFRFEMALKRLAPVIIEASKNEKAAAIIKDIFGENSKDPGTIRFIVEGGKSLKASLTVSALVVKFISKAAQARMKEAVEQEGKAEKDADQARRQAEKARAEAIKALKEAEKARKKNDK